jgi:hypothetical protein
MNAFAREPTRSAMRFSSSSNTSQSRLDEPVGRDPHLLTTYLHDIAKANHVFS